jgi:hypothetical protein
VTIDEETWARKTAIEALDNQLFGINWMMVLGAFSLKDPSAIFTLKDNGGKLTPPSLLSLPETSDGLANAPAKRTSTAKSGPVHRARNAVLDHEVSSLSALVQLTGLTESQCLAALRFERVGTRECCVPGDANFERHQKLMIGVEACRNESGRGLDTAKLIQQVYKNFEFECDGKWTRPPVTPPQAF